MLNPLTGNLLGDADRVNNNNNNVAPTPQFSPTALLNLRSLASKRPASSGSDLNRGRTNLTIATSPAKRIKTNKDRKKSTHRQGFNSSSSLKLQKTSSQAPSQTGLLINLTIIGDNIEELICVGKVKHTYVQAHTVPYPDPKKYLGNSTGNNRNNLNIIVTNPTSREFSRVDMKSLTRLCLLIDGAKAYDIGKFHKGKNIQLLRPVFELYDSLTRIQAIDSSFQTDYIYVLRSVDKIWADVADVFDTVVSKSDEVPTREPSTLYFMWDKEQDHSAEEHDYRKFYRLVITAYIMLPERALLILFMT
ncbi:hypothetical protein HBI37_112830 [Parastagonospora nodorum]|nr:hypothetical protein HBI37_112830 [Parastagonospora nodorum]